MKDGTLKTFLLTALVIIILLLLHFLPTISIGGIKLRKVNILSQIIKLPGDDEVTDVIPKPKDPKKIEARGKSGKLLNFKEIWPKGVQPILDYSEGQPGGMDHFYAMVDSATSHKLKDRPVRIAYYGDSFIEADMMIEDLREQLQAKYGGGGVGWIDAGNDLEQYKITIKAAFSGMTEHMVMKKNAYNVANAGIAERYYTTQGKSSLTLNGTKYYPHTSSWNRSRLYFRSNGRTSVKCTIDKGVNSSQTFSPSNDVQVFNLNGQTTRSSFRISGSPILFGAAVENDGGIVVDNFSMRGSTGTTLATLPENTLREFNNVRPYDLIVLQFGVNAVDASTSSDDMHKYLAEMRKVIRHMKRCFPEASILVVSTPDRGNNATGGTMGTIKMLEGFQKELAAEEKVGFFSLFRSMGGEGAMARLHDKGMTSADMVHISRTGGKIVANGVFKSFVAGEENYKRRRKLEMEN